MTLDSVFITSVVDDKESRDVRVIEIMGTYIHSKIYEEENRLWVTLLVSARM